MAWPTQRLRHCGPSRRGIFTSGSTRVLTSGVSQRQAERRGTAQAEDQKASRSADGNSITTSSSQLRRWARRAPGTKQPSPEGAERRRRRLPEGLERPAREENPLLACSAARKTVRPARQEMAALRDDRITHSRVSWDGSRDGVSDTASLVYWPCHTVPFLLRCSAHTIMRKKRMFAEQSILDAARCVKGQSKRFSQEKT